MVSTSQILAVFQSTSGQARATTKRPRLTRRFTGLTLVELMVVVGIILLLLTIVVPRVQPDLEQIAVRDAARNLQVLLTSARIKAVDAGQFVAVMFHRDDTNPAICRVVTSIEAPIDNYSEGPQAFVRVGTWQLPNAAPIILIAVTEGAIAPGVVSVGDRIRFNNTGPWFVIRGGVEYPIGNVVNFSDGRIELRESFIDEGGNYVPGGAVPPWRNYHAVYLVAEMEPPISPASWPSAAAGLPNLGWPQVTPAIPPREFSVLVTYTVQRMPRYLAQGGRIARRLGQTFTLPRQAAIDLAFSGLGDSGRFGLLPSPVTILFAPDGSVAWFLDNPKNLRPVSSPIYFLVGRVDRAPVAESGGQPLAEDGLLNFQDPSNYWVVVEPKSGHVNVARVADSKGAPSLPEALAVSRSLARQAQIYEGGR